MEPKVSVSESFHPDYGTVHSASGEPQQIELRQCRPYADTLVTLRTVPRGVPGGLTEEELDYGAEGNYRWIMVGRQLVDDKPRNNLCLRM